MTEADPGFQVRGGVHLKKSRRAEGGAKFVGVFRVKNHDFTQKKIWRKKPCSFISVFDQYLHYVIKFVSDLRFGGFLGVIRFPPPINLTATI